MVATFKPVLAAVTLAAGLQFATPTSAVEIWGFSGPFAPSEWTLFNSVKADGFVDVSDAPDAITLVGSSNGSGRVGNTAYTTFIAEPTTLKFAWGFADTQASHGFFLLGSTQTFNDVFGYVIAEVDCTLYSQFPQCVGPGLFTQLTTGNAQSGKVDLDLPGNRVFGFQVSTPDNLGRRGKARIFDFQAIQPDTTVPEPGIVMALSVFALGWLGLGRTTKVEGSRFH